MIASRQSRALIHRALSWTRLCRHHAVPSTPAVASQRRYFSTDESIEDDTATVSFQKDHSTENSAADEFPRSNLKPSSLVSELDLHIVGQADAKRAVAVALRNRWRRHSLAPDMRQEVTPRNILMIGPTGCGKTEIARRLAKITDAPFIKVEATKFTEVGFYGKDVDTIIKDLARVTLPQMKARRRDKYKERVAPQVEQLLLDAIIASVTAENASGASQSSTDSNKDNTILSSLKQSYIAKLRAGELENVIIEIELPQSTEEKSGGSGNNAVIVQILSGSSPRFFRGQIKKCLVSEARPLLIDAELNKVMNNDDLNALARKAIEEDGIVFIDEIDKICSSSSESFKRSGHADASAEGVQRDLLPLIEGSTISTSLGLIDTSHILFICSGAFHSVKPSDLLPELQGRLPIRVELKPLTEEDFYKILTVPVNNLLVQQVELLKTDGIELVFEDNAVREIARMAVEVNRAVENIGARRLNTIIAQIVDDISYQAPDLPLNTRIVIDKPTVVNKVAPLIRSADLTRYIL